MDNLSISLIGGVAIQASCIGSIIDVIAGKMPSSLDGKVFNAPDYRYGFLLASPHDKYSLGETVIVNNNCYTTSTDKNKPGYNKTIYGPKFVTSGVFLIPHEAKPTYRVTLDARSKPMPILDLYNAIYESVDCPMTFVGLIEFADFHAIAIGKSPIDGVNIFSNHQEYYSNPPVVAKNVYACIIGVLTDYRQTKYDSLNQQLKVVVYSAIHPGDSDGVGAQLTNHAHVLTLKHAVADISAITPEIADQVLHMFIDGTTVAQAHLDIYTVGSITNLTN